MTTVTLGLPPLPPKWTGKFRKRPVVVEAVQLVDDDACDWDEIARWCGGRIYNIETSPGAEPQTLIDIPTLEGTMTAGEGWWVVRGVVGEFYPVRADIFKATYEPAGSATGGKAVYETWRAAVPDVVCNVPGGPWDDLPAAVQAGFGAIDGRLAAETERREQAEAEAARLRRLLEDQGRGDEAREFLTPAEAALRLRVHPRTLSRLVAAGKLTPDKTPGGHRRYRAAEIEVARLERAGKEAR